MNIRYILTQLLLLLFFQIGFGFWAVYCGKDINWDLQNYHFYAPYALLNNRIGWDIAPGQLQSYLNPIFDFPFYIFLKIFNKPILITFLMGALHGIVGFLLAKLSWAVFRNQAAGTRIFYSSLAVFIGLTGAAGLPVVGTTLIGWEPAGLFIGSLLLIVLGVNKQGGTQSTFFAIAGLLVGIAVGGKLTVAVFAIALIASLLATYRDMQFYRKAILPFIIFMMIGFLAIDGFWLYKMYQEFDNPLFPYLNHIFKSPWAEFSSMQDRRFFPRDIYQFIFYPFYWLKNNHLAAELDFRDIRFALIYTLLLVFFIKVIFNKISKNEKNKINIFLIIYFLISYILWQLQFSIYRYLIPLELLTGIILVILIQYLIKSPTLIKLALIMITITCAMTTHYPNWGRAKFDDVYFDAPIISTIPPRSLTVLVGDNPMSYLIPLADPSIRFISIQNNLLEPKQNNLMVAQERAVINEFIGKIYSLSLADKEKETASILEKMNLKIDLKTCLSFKPNIGEMLMLCELNRAAK